MMILNFLTVIGLSGLLLAGTEASEFYYFKGPYLQHVRSGDAVHFQNYYNPWHNQTFDLLQTLSDAKEINLPCRNSLARWLAGLKAKEAWALKFLEATGKTVNGRLIGRDVNFGSFEFCTNYVRNEADNVDFDGKYCMVSVQTKESEMISQKPSYQSHYRSVSDSAKQLLEFNLGNAHGICIPSTCDMAELASVTNKILKPIGFRVLPATRCTTISEPEPLTPLQIFSFSIIGIFVFLCLLSFFVKTNFLNHFSPIQNSKIIYSDSKNVEESYLHGVKGFMMVCSISAHTVVYMGTFFAQPYSSVTSQEVPAYIIPFIKRFLFWGAQLSILGGFFSMHAWYDIVKNNPKKFNFKTYFMMRYFRLLMIAIPMLLLYFILPHLGSGPYYSEVTNHIYSSCKRTAWKFFTVSTNIGDEQIDMCNVGSWYISTDFQLLPFTYLITYYLITKPKIGLLLAFLQGVVFSAISVIYISKKNISGFLNAFEFDINGNTMQQVQHYHFNFFHHFNGYALGLICAYLVKSKIKPKILDHKLVRIGIWIFVVALNYAVYMYPHHLEENNLKANEQLEFLYPVIGRFTMSMLFFWFLYSMGIGYSRPIRRSFSWKGFVPWSRLSFAISLLQFIYIQYAYLQSTNSYTFRPFDMLKEFYLAHMFIFFLSNAVFLFMEGPLISLFKHYTGQKQRSEIRNSHPAFEQVDVKKHELKKD